MTKLSAKSKIIAAVLLASFMPVLVSLTVYSLFGSTRRVDEPLHECLELVGSRIALAVAMLRVRYESSGPLGICS